MKNFKRKNLLLSLCGLNCGLCPMHLNQYCPGCGGGEGNQPCRTARCSMEHGKVEYCSQCEAYPCAKYETADEFDSFITHRNQIKDLQKVQDIGEQAYILEQQQKQEILHKLLENYNDGRKKTLYCLAVNLLEKEELQEAMQEIASMPNGQEAAQKEKAAYAAKILKDKARKRGIELKLRKKP